MESWGRGIEKIFNTCASAGTPQPVYTLEPGGIWLEFPFEKSVGSGTETSIENMKENMKERILIEIKKNKNITVKEIINLTGTTRGSVNHHIETLKNDGVIKRKGSTKKGHWEVLK